MKIEGKHSFAASRKVLWKALLDPEILSRTLPGCRELVRTGENEFKGVLSIRVGPVQGQFNGIVALSDLRPEEGYRLKLNGTGPAGFVQGEGEVQLEEADGGTELHYRVDAKVGGRVASVGQRLLESSARVITRQALEQLERQVGELTEDGGGDKGASSSVEAPSQAGFVAATAKGVAGELVPPKLRPVVAVVALAGILVAGFLMVRACG